MCPPVCLRVIASRCVHVCVELLICMLLCMRDADVYAWCHSPILLWWSLSLSAAGTTPRLAYPSVEVLLLGCAARGE